MTVEQENELLELVREMRNDFRLMREVMQPKYENKAVRPMLRYKGAPEIEVAENKNVSQ